MSLNDMLSGAAAKAAPRRFTAEPITGFGPLLPEDSLVERIEQIWNLHPTERSGEAVQRPADEVPSECNACEGSGRIPFGEFGAYYRDGETYDAPGEVVCEECGGSGRVAE